MLLLSFSPLLDYGTRAKSPEGKAVAQNSLNILQNQYPERLGALCKCIYIFIFSCSLQSSKIVYGISIHPFHLHLFSR